MFESYYDAEQKRLVIGGQLATPTYWDGVWEKQGDLEKLLRQGSRDPMVRRITKKHLNPGTGVRVLDGGCGKGQHVADLGRLGYEAYGVDYAEETIREALEVLPELRLTVADVRQLPFSDNYFNGYWSLGVIEHFWDGYERAAQEMRRVIAPEGYLFLVFPHMSRLRRLKARLGMYPPYKEKEFDHRCFYQFALDEKKVAEYFQQLGFTRVAAYRNNGFKGIKEEILWLNKPLNQIGKSNWLPWRVSKVVISEGAKWLASHTIVLVLKKT